MGDVGRETAVSSEDPMTAEVYEIKVKGHLVQEWSDFVIRSKGGVRWFIIESRD